MKFDVTQIALLFIPSCCCYFFIIYYCSPSNTMKYENTLFVSLFATSANMSQMDGKGDGRTITLKLLFKYISLYIGSLER